MNISLEEYIFSSDKLNSVNFASAERPRARLSFKTVYSDAFFAVIKIEGKDPSKAVAFLELFKRIRHFGLFAVQFLLKLSELVITSC